MSLILRHVLPILGAICVAAATLPAAVVSPDAYLPEDAYVTGRQLHAFEADGELVSIVVGDFTMKLGARSFSGRDAVMWVNQSSQGGRIYRRIELYIEGKATVVEPGGTSTTDEAMLVTLRQSGQFFADVDQSHSQDMSDLPIYRRATQLRQAAATGRPVQREGQIVTATQPTTPEREDALEPANGAVMIQTPAEPKRIQFQADSIRITSRPDLGDDAGRSVGETVCKGNVYLAHGGTAQISPVQIQADAAVLFTADADDTEGETGEETAAGPMGSLLVLGAYLEGDVRLTSGEKVIRGDRLYYDFANERAIILDAVYRTIHEKRNIPLYIRAEQIRLQTQRTDGRITRRDVLVDKAKISTSEFFSPTYHVGVHWAKLSDTTPYDFDGEPLEEKSYEMRAKHSTINVRGVPVFYTPWSASRVKDTEVPIHRLQLGDHGRFGPGVESRWRLFQLLGLIEPRGFDTDLLVDTYEKGTVVGIDMEYSRDDSWGFLLGNYTRDHNKDDDFGQDIKDIPAPADRGRVLWRHKGYFPEDWQVQAEVSYLVDKNYLQSYYRNEFWAGKEQETLAYARKQTDNWAFTALVKGRINDFQTVSESHPDFAFYLIGQPLWADRLTLFSESHGGVLRLQEANDSPLDSSRNTARVDQRVELNAPAHWGPLNIVPYGMGRTTYWSRSLVGNDLGRVIGGGGVKANLSFWRTYNSIRSRLLDLYRLRHILTPEVNAIGLAANRTPAEVYPFSTDIEQRLEAFQGVRVGVNQRWQTYRGRPGQRRSVEFARLNLYAAFFNDTKDPDQGADGRYYFSRPEYSITRNAINGDMAVNISDSTAVLGDMNYDMNDRELGLANLGLAVQRDPRLRYYLGSRFIDDLDSWVWTAGLNYKINSKYELAGFQQYDMKFDGGTSLRSHLSLIRKFPRWYLATTLVVDRTTNDIGFVVTLWPEGMPDFRIGGSRVGTWAASELN